MRLSLNILEPIPDGVDKEGWQGNAKDTAQLQLPVIVCCSHMALT
jgi:hypothetical protein